MTEVIDLNTAKTEAPKAGIIKHLEAKCDSYIRAGDYQRHAIYTELMQATVALKQRIAEVRSKRPGLIDDLIEPVDALL